ncbi:MAG: hypothetical protein JSW39_22725 [Desulfobacterales bacterium]|nr:MAG: hypothetical protein JSW39_22725 [Desulfobacterales bacterium]
MSDLPSVNPDDWVDKYGDALFRFALARLNDSGLAEEICKILNITPTNCWVMLYRARMLLRRCIESDWIEGKG